MKTLYRHHNAGLTAEQALKIHEVIENALLNDIKMNRFWTINLKNTVHEHTPQKLMGKIMKGSREWLNRRGFEHACVWVLENGKYNGLHIHLLLFVPNRYQIAFKKALYRWCEIDKSLFKHEPINCSPFDYYNENKAVHGIRKYISKGITAKDKENPLIALLGINPSYQGKVLGRRCGFSQLIEKTKAN